MEALGGPKWIWIPVSWSFYAGIGNRMVEHKTYTSISLDSTLNLPFRAEYVCWLPWAGPLRSLLRNKGLALQWSRSYLGWREPRPCSTPGTVLIQCLINIVGMKVWQHCPNSEGNFQAPSSYWAGWGLHWNHTSAQFLRLSNSTPSSHLGLQCDVYLTLSYTSSKLISESLSTIFDSRHQKLVEKVNKIHVKKKKLLKPK